MPKAAIATATRAITPITATTGTFKAKVAATDFGVSTWTVVVVLVPVEFRDHPEKA